MEWYNAQSAEKPETMDTTSSQQYNYARRNIEETQIENQDGAKLTVYNYEEAKVPKESWGLYLELVQQRADIDYLSMVTEE